MGEDKLNFQDIRELDDSIAEGTLPLQDVTNRQSTNSKNSESPFAEILSPNPSPLAVLSPSSPSAPPTKQRPNPPHPNSKFQSSYSPPPTIQPQLPLPYSSHLTLPFPHFSYHILPLSPSSHPTLPFPHFSYHILPLSPSSHPTLPLPLSSHHISPTIQSLLSMQVMPMLALPKVTIMSTQKKSPIVIMTG